MRSTFVADSFNFATNSLLGIAILATLVSCGVQKLHPDDYIEFGRGEKALLVTKNPELIDPIQWFFNDLLGEPGSEEEVTIDKIDGEKVKFNFILHENQHVLIEPGTRTVKLRCSVHYKDKNSESLYGDSAIEINFKGGFKYEARPGLVKDDKCSATIESDDRYNNSIRQAEEQDSEKFSKSVLE